MTIRPAPAVPDLTDTILERIPGPSGAKWPVRIGLGIVAVAQLSLAVAQLLGVATGMNGAQEAGFMTGHLTHESAAWNLAVGVGLLFASLRPQAAAGQLPLLTGFVLVLTALSAGDLAGHEVTPGRILSHGLVVLGLVLAYVVHRQRGNDHRPNPVAGDVGSTETSTRVESSARHGDLTVESRQRHRPWRRPASRHRAA